MEKSTSLSNTTRHSSRSLTLIEILVTVVLCTIGLSLLPNFIFQSPIPEAVLHQTLHDACCVEWLRLKAKKKNGFLGYGKWTNGAFAWDNSGAWAISYAIKPIEGTNIGILVWQATNKNKTHTVLGPRIFVHLLS